MDIHFYNTLTHRVEPFESIEPRPVRIYTCGPTVYDYAHIGNFRAFVFADLLRRFLEFTGHRVEHVMNITDVGHMTEDQLADGGGRDKMELAAERLKHAKKQGRADVADPTDPYQIARFFTAAFLDDARRLRLKVADEPDRHMPRATGHIRQMKDLIERLIETGHAYPADDGAVYYDVRSFPDYGRLSGNTLDKLHAGAGGRVTDAHLAGKRNPNDFLLWKSDEKHLMRWPSPWGVGYPGWHIECSAMAMHTLKAETLDIHTGGEDNIFPHHECEIAQSSGATGKPFARFWMHTRFLMVEGEKMSKSKGNFHTVRDLLSKGVDPAALRYELLKTHYRQNMNFTWKGLEDSAKAVGRFQSFVDTQTSLSRPTDPHMGDTAVEREFAGALADDLNISAALGVVHKWIRATANPSKEDVAAFLRLDNVLRLTRLNVDASVELNTSHNVSVGTETALSDADIQAMCRQLDAARADRDFTRSDTIRDELQAAGVEVQTTKQGTTWRRKLIH